MGTGVYLESRTALDAFLRPILHDIVAIVEHGRRMTVTVTDVLLALKRNGRFELILPLPHPLLLLWSFLHSSLALQWQQTQQGLCLLSASSGC